MRRFERAHYRQDKSATDSWPGIGCTAAGGFLHGPFALPSRCICIGPALFWIVRCAEVICGCEFDARKISLSLTIIRKTFLELYNCAYYYLLVKYLMENPMIFEFY